MGIFRVRFVFFFICISLAAVSCRDKKDRPIKTDVVSPTPEEINAEVRLFPSDDGWGYDIYVNDQKYIHQPYIPVIEGNHPFKSEEDARKVGELMVQKIEGNIVPPTITKEELEVLEIVTE